MGAIADRFPFCATVLRASLQLFLSGTPVQNKISEFYTLLNLIDEDAFPSRDEFESQYGSMSNSTDIQALHKALSPYMFRRMKAEVEKELPPREETLISVEMTSEQKQSVTLRVQCACARGPLWDALVHRSDALPSV